MVFPDRTTEISIHQREAQRYRQEGNHEAARASYMKWVESLRQQNVNTGRFADELNAARKEYSDFAKSDPTYVAVCEAVLPMIKAKPGILQTEIYKLIPQFERAAVSYALYFAADHGRVKRDKKGNTYSLTLTS
jgi:hypothetical protein